MFKHLYVPPSLFNLFQDLLYWLQEDGDYLEPKYLFLQYLLHISPNFHSFSSFQNPSQSTDKTVSARVSIASHLLNFAAIQYCIDSCPYIYNKPSLIHFLNSIGCTYQGEPLSSSFFNMRKDINFNFRLRHFEPTYSGQLRVFPEIDKFISKHPNFKKQFIELLSEGNFN